MVVFKIVLSDTLAWRGARFRLSQKTGSQFLGLMTRWREGELKKKILIYPILQCPRTQGSSNAFRRWYPKRLNSTQMITAYHTQNYWKYIFLKRPLHVIIEETWHTSLTGLFWSIKTFPSLKNYAKTYTIYKAWSNPHASRISKNHNKQKNSAYSL